MGLFKKKKIEIDVNNLPKHIAFIIDGNGRWAKERSMPRTYGHKVGVDAVANTIENCLQLGIKQVSFYCFSTENWNRPKQEIDTIFELMRNYISNNTNNYIEKGVKLVVSGDI